jgi:hypothetical protein
MPDSSIDPQMPAPQPENAQPPEVTSRRNILRLGAVAGGVVLTVRPGIAQAAASVISCNIPVPDPAHGGQYVAADGSLVPAGTTGAFPGGRTFGGEAVRSGLAGGNLPGASYEESQAYLNYIRRLNYGTSGFTCFASLQMPK